MESGTFGAGRVSPRPPRRWKVDPRWMGIAIVTEVTAIFLTYMVVNRPVVGALLTPDEQREHWPAALAPILHEAAAAPGSGPLSCPPEQ